MTPTELRKARDKLGMTQEQLADAIGISREQLADYERGQHSKSRPIRTVPRVVEAAVMGLFCRGPKG